MKYLITFFSGCLVVALGQQAPAATTTPAPAATTPTTPKEKILAEWKDVTRKITTLAAEFPESKYDYRPVPDVRTFAQQMLHLAFWNQFLAKSARGEHPDPKPNELPRSAYGTKETVTTVLRESFEIVLASLQEAPQEEIVKRINLWATFLEHSGEHYGQAAMYYRLNGLTPPESRR